MVPINLIGEATVLVTADGSTFEESLKGQTDPALAGLETDAGASGTIAGQNLRTGVKDGASGLESDMADTGVLAGAGLRTGVEDGTKDVASDLEKVGKDGGSKFTSALSGALSMLSGGLITTNSGIDSMASKMDNAGNHATGLGGTLSNVGGKIALVGAVGFLAFSAAAVKLGMDFQTSMASIAANAKIPITAANAIGQAFLSTAGSTIYSAGEIATAFVPVVGQLGEVNGKALTASQSLSFMKTAMDLAEASGTSLASATTAVANTLQAFQLGLGQATTVSDLLFSSSRLTGTAIDTEAGTLDKFRAKLGDAAPPLSQLVALQVDLATHGETGSRVLMGLSATLTGLMTPTAAVTAAQQALGVSFITSSGQLVSMSSIISQVGPIIAGMGNAQATAELKTLGFGTASAKLVTTIQAGLPAYDAATAKVTAVGAAHAAAAIQAQTLGHEMDTLKATVEDAATKWGIVLIPVLKDAIKAFVDVATAIVKCTPLLIGIGVVLAGLVIWWVGNTIAAMAFWTAATGGIILLVAALAVGIAWIVDHWHQVWTDCKNWFDDAINAIKSTWDTVWGDIKKVFDDFVNFLRNNPIAQILEAIFAPLLLLALHWQQVWADIKSWTADVINFFVSIPGTIAHVWSDVVNAIHTAWSVVSGWVNTTVIQPIVQFFAAIPSTIAHVWSDVVSALETAWNVISGWVNTTVIQPIVAFFTGIPGTIAHVWSDVVSALETAWGAISGWVNTTVVQPVVGFFTGIPGTIAHVWSDVVTALDKAWGAISGWVSTNVTGPIVAAFQAVLGPIQTVVNAVKAAWNFIFSGPTAPAANQPNTGVVIPKAGVGGLFSSATVALIGETGPELVLTPALTAMALKSGIGPLPGLGALPTTGTGGIEGNAQISSNIITIQSGAFVVNVGPGATATAATQAVQQGIAAMTDELRAGRSPIRGGLTHGS